MGRAQIATEFAFMVMLSLAFLASTLIVVAFYLERSQTQAIDAGLTDVVSQVQQELLLAATVEDGYTRIFFIPETVEGQGYALTNDHTTVTATSPNGPIAIKLIPSVNGTLQRGENTLRRHSGMLCVNAGCP
jgi:hypothetical protein